MDLAEKKYFGVAEAEKLLPQITEILTRLMAINKTLAAFNQIKLSFADDFDAYAHEITKNKNFHKLNHELFEGMERLLEMGVLAKDLNIGLIDFYSMWAGREIFLCWKIGEPRIEYWHELSTGFKGRKHISQLAEV